MALLMTGSAFIDWLSYWCGRILSRLNEDDEEREIHEHIEDDI